MNDVTRSIALFPGAGSFGSEFRLLLAELKPTAWLVRYPGRYGRDFGVPAASFDEVVRACTEQISGQSLARPVLFGHSFGAYVAYATALRLQEAGIGACALLVAGASAPSQLDVPEQALCTPAAAAEHLSSVDPSALADAPSDDWREVVIETAMHDLRLLRQFGVAPSASVCCPILGLRGEGDTLTSDPGVAEWEHCTSGLFSPHSFPGGHSDFLRSPACTSSIREILESLSQVR